MDKHDAELIRKSILKQVIEPVMIKHGIAPALVPDITFTDDMPTKKSRKLQTLIERYMQKAIGTPINYTSIARQLIVTDTLPVGDTPVYDLDVEKDNHDPLNGR